MPIVNWSVEDVWEYLTSDVLGWSDSIPVRRLYREATGECGLQTPKAMEEKLRLSKMESCGARFGCWLCPVVSSDKSTEEMSDHHVWLRPLSDYRELQNKIYGSYVPPKQYGQPRKERSEDLRKWEAINEQIRLRTKAGRNRRGKRMKDGQGTFTVEARKWLFQALIDTEKAVNFLRVENGLPEIKLISEEEISLIKEYWEDDTENAQHLVSNELGISLKGVDELIEGRISDATLNDYKQRWKEKQLQLKKKES